MLVPIENLVGSGYNAGLTATAFMYQPDGHAGAGYTTPSGVTVGGQKLGVDAIRRAVEGNQGQRYMSGPPAVRAISESGYVAKDRAAPYMTEGEVRLSGLGDLPANEGFFSKGVLTIFAVAAAGMLLSRGRGSSR